MTQYILALDQGTTSSRAIVFDVRGNLRAIAQKEFRQIFPQSGWVEHDANEIWASQLGVANEALAQMGIRAKDLAAIGITNQRETTIVWDRTTGQPIYSAIVWQDRRTAGWCDALKAAGHEPTFQAKTGLLLDPYFSGTKLKWLLDHVPGARVKAEQGDLAFGTVDTWLVWQLTGGQLHLTDVTNASRTLLFNIHTQQWDEELLSLLEIPAAILPEVRSSSEVFGVTGEGILGAQVPIAGIAGDQQAATFGQACLQPGMAKNTYGTGCFAVLNTGNAPISSHHKLLTTIAWRISQPTIYALEGSVFVAGAVVQWLRDGLGILKHSADVEPLARSVPDNGGVYFVPAFVGLGAPHWDSYARGTIIGLTRGSTSAHIARAALESIAYQSVDVLDAMRRDAKLDLSELRVDGGAAGNDLMMQFQADVLGVPVVRPQITETTALGAAYLAGLAVGYWQSTADITRQWQMERRFEPQMSDDRRTSLLAAWRQAVERAKHQEIAG
ncbi:MAG: glycerol kinase GlpK [Scytolyngbya sp. HA4215-MV1]|nr:glycerol kinase GlpK [Scytolyngbya sp. HA4215-MV1]